MLRPTASKPRLSSSSAQTDRLGTGFTTSAASALLAVALLLSGAVSVYPAGAVTLALASRVPVAALMGNTAVMV